MNRALRAATLGVLLLTPVTLTACSAGQVTQTASQDRDKIGPSAQVGDLALRAVQVAPPCELGDEDTVAYESGDNAELLLSIANSTREDDALVGVSGDVFDGVFVDELPDQSTPTTTPGTPGGTDAPGDTDTPGGTEAPGTGTAPTPSAAPTAAPTASTTVDVPVPANAVTTIGLRQYDPAAPCDPEVDPDTPRLFLADLDLDAPLTASQTVSVTLTFENAGEVTVQALVAGPAEALPRGEAFDFHSEE